MESLLTKLYSHCKVGDSEVATNASSSESIPGKEETAPQATCPSHQKKSVIPRSIQCHEETSPHRSGALPFRSLDATTDELKDSSPADNTRLHVPVFQRPSSTGNLSQTTAAAGVSNAPPYNAVALHVQGTRSELESGGTTTASRGLLVGQRSSGEPVTGQTLCEGDVSMSCREMESFELLDVSEFENDNSLESLPPSPLQTGPKSTSPSLASETRAATEKTTSSFQFHQSKYVQPIKGLNPLVRSFTSRRAISVCKFYYVSQLPVAICMAYIEPYNTVHEMLYKTL